MGARNKGILGAVLWGLILCLAYMVLRGNQTDEDLSPGIDHLSAADQEWYRIMTSDVGTFDAGDCEVIATISGVDRMNQIHIKSLLIRAGIPSIIEGSLGHGISVRRPDRQRAITLLREDAAKNQYWIKFSEGEPRLYEAAEEDWEMIELNTQYEVVLGSGRFSESADVEAVLKCADVKSAASRFGYVQQIKVLRREYMMPDGTFHNGCKVEVFLSDGPKDQGSGNRTVRKIWRAGVGIH